MTQPQPQAVDMAASFEHAAEEAKRRAADHRRRADYFRRQAGLHDDMAATEETEADRRSEWARSLRHGKASSSG